VQLTLHKDIEGLSALSYDDRMKLLNLERLEIRRLRFDLLCCYKIIFGLVRVISWSLLWITYELHKMSFLQTL